MYIYSCMSRKISQLKLKYFFFFKFGGGLMLGIKITTLFVKEYRHFVKIREVQYLD